ncbi:hypothetical protein XENTR_v10023064 [Xenopus tropicalis]|nr:hypothetical protein XENTR_v10023064 [Xenopus tropicalis]
MFHASFKPECASPDSHRGKTLLLFRVRQTLHSSLKPYSASQTPHVNAFTLHREVRVLYREAIYYHIINHH